MYKISITFGSEPYLSKIISRYPNKKLYLLHSLSDSNQCQLIENSITPSILSNPEQFKILFQKNEINSAPFVRFDYFSINESIISVFDSMVKNLKLPSTIVNIRLLKPLQSSSANRLIISYHTKLEPNPVDLLADKYQNKEYFKTIYAS